MTNVSKNKLKKKVEQDMYKHMVQLFSITTNHTAGVFCDELFTSAEKTMLAKRIAAIALLGSGVSMYRVSRTLKLSHTTVKKYQRELTQGKYAMIRKTLRKEEFDWKSFWETVEKISRGGLPPMDGRRWQSLHGGR